MVCFEYTQKTQTLKVTVKQNAKMTYKEK